MARTNLAKHANAAQENAVAASPPTPPTQFQNTKEVYRFVEYYENPSSMLSTGVMGQSLCSRARYAGSAHPGIAAKNGSVYPGIVGLQ